MLGRGLVCAKPTSTQKKQLLCASVVHLLFLRDHPLKLHCSSHDCPQSRLLAMIVKKKKKDCELESTPVDLGVGRRMGVGELICSMMNRCTAR